MGAICLLASACASESERPNIVLISIDSLRADHLGAYGYHRPTSPNIDRIAAEGIVFERAYSTTSWTLPSHLSMLSGRYPDDHGVVNDMTRLGDGVELLPELLATEGYRSAAVVSGLYLHGRYGYDRGWERYDDRLAPLKKAQEIGPEAASRVTSDAVHAAAVGLLDHLEGGPFFLFLHYFDVHFDYRPPPPWDTAFDSDYTGPVDGLGVRDLKDARARLPERDLEHLVALYDGEIAWVDHWLGELDAELTRRGLRDRTMLIVTADHGEEFYEHGRLAHQANLFDTTLQVPLVVRLPGGRFAGIRSAEPVSLVDLLPTITDPAGARRPPRLPGRNLIPRRSTWREPAPADLHAGLAATQKALIRGPWKLIAVARERRLDPGRLYLSNRLDAPGELTNLAEADRRFTARLFVDLRRMSTDLARSSRAHPPVPLSRTPELESQLRALGYL
jgi:arylsulfatase A-like enzyme